MYTSNTTSTPSSRNDPNKKCKHGLKQSHLCPICDTDNIGAAASLPQQERRRDVLTAWARVMGARSTTDIQADRQKVTVELQNTKTQLSEAKTQLIAMKASSNEAADQKTYTVELEKRLQQLISHEAQLQQQSELGQHGATRYDELAATHKLIKESTDKCCGCPSQWVALLEFFVIILTIVLTITVEEAYAAALAGVAAAALLHWGNTGSLRPIPGHLPARRGPRRWTYEIPARTGLFVFAVAVGVGYSFVVHRRDSTCFPPSMNFTLPDDRPERCERLDRLFEHMPQVLQTLLWCGALEYGRRLRRLLKAEIGEHDGHDRRTELLKTAWSNSQANLAMGSSQPTSAASQARTDSGLGGRNESLSPTIFKPLVSPSRPAQETPQVEGQSGLRNLGNTCYMNALVQFLRLIPCPPLTSCGSDLARSCLYLINFLNNPSAGQELQEGALKQLHTLVLQQQKTVNQHGASVRVKRFVPNRQEDAFDLLCCFNDVLWSRTTELTTTLTALFMRECQSCKKTWSRSDSDFSLRARWAPATDNERKDLKELLLASTSADSDSEMSQCQGLETTCVGDTSVKTNMVITNWPSHLIIHVARFAYESSNGAKLQAEVTVPALLDCGGLSHESMPTPPTYKLVAMVLHRGSTLQSGHYRTCLLVDGQWLMFDDESVQRVEESTLSSDEFAQQVYLVLYEKLPEQGATERPIRLANDLGGASSPELTTAKAVTFSLPPDSSSSTSFSEPAFDLDGSESEDKGVERVTLTAQQTPPNPVDRLLPAVESGIHESPPPEHAEQRPGWLALLWESWQGAPSEQEDYANEESVV
eukprot:m.255152 g.255152  ORF g.255152 m.255152 type:complete len:818 (+) comp19156_c0_seq7:93-2546(+)